MSYIINIKITSVCIQSIIIYVVINLIIILCITVT